MRERLTREAAKPGCATYAAPGRPVRSSIQLSTATSAWRTPEQPHSRPSWCSSTRATRPCTARGRRCVHAATQPRLAPVLRSGGDQPAPVLPCRGVSDRGP